MLNSIGSDKNLPDIFDVFVFLVGGTKGSVITAVILA